MNSGNEGSVFASLLAILTWIGWIPLGLLALIVVILIAVRNKRLKPKDDDPRGGPHAHNDF